MSYITHISRQFIATCMGTSLLLLVPVNAYADSICTSESLIRKISVLYSAPGKLVPCQVVYEKPDQNQYMTLWRAQNQEGYCEQQAKSFAQKLGTLGWNCSDAPMPGAENAAEAQSAAPKGAGESRVRKTFRPANPAE